MESPGHNLFCSKQSMQYLWPTCRGEIFFVNVDFDVLGHPREKKRDPQHFWRNKYCNKFFYFSLLLVLFAFDFYYFFE